MSQDSYSAYQSRVVTIANGTTTSGSVDLGEGTIVGLQTPSALTSTAITLQAAYDNSTFCAVTDKAGSAYSITVAASKYIAISPLDLAGIRYVKLVGGSSEGADRTLILMLKKTR